MTTRWGAQTELAVRNFPISGEPMPMAVIVAIALVKAEAAPVNAELGVLDAELAAAVRAACDEIVEGHHPDQFPVDVFQTGSGTSTNMNVNEVAAHRATELLGRAVHPNDHVNASQSSNDVVPSAIRIAAALEVHGATLPALRSLASTLRSRATEFADTVTLGRTHLMDAAPVTFGQQLGGWARMVELGTERIEQAAARVRELPLGGTAVGSGLNAPAGFASAVIARVSARTGVAFNEAVDHFEAQSSQDALVDLGAACRAVGLSLYKIAGDLRLLGSGPAGGMGEVHLPALQAGSSIMPGKVNPVIPEAVQQVTAQLVGNDATLAFASTMSTLQLNTAMPVMGRAVLSSVSLLGAAARVLEETCIAGLTVDADRMRHLAERSASTTMVLVPLIGYERATAVAERMAREGRRLAEVLAEEGIDGGDVDLLRLARPHDGERPSAPSAT